MTDEAQAELLRLLRAAWEPMVDRITAQVLEQITAFRGLDRAELRSSFDRIARLLATPLGGKPIPDEGLRSARLVGAHRARDGFDLAAVIAAVAVARDVCVDQFSRLMRDLPLAGAVEGGVAQLVDVPLTAAHAAVVQELAAGFQEGKATLVADASPHVRFVERVLFPFLDDDVLAAEDATALGYAAGTTRWGVAVVAGTGAGALSEVRDALAAVAEVDDVLEGPASQQPAPHVAVLLAAPSDSAWPGLVEAISTKLVSTGAALVVGDRPGSLAECRRQYERLARNVGYVRVFPSVGHPVDRALLQWCRTLGESPDVERSELFRETLGVLLDDPRRDDLFPLLDALVLTGEQRLASDLLGYDESTVRRYLRHIERGTGRAWSNHFDRFAITTAVLCRWLAAQDVDEYAAHRFGPPPNFRRLRGRAR